MILLDGKTYAAELKEELKAKIAADRALGFRQPGLAVILLGDNPASQIYVRNKEREAKSIGIAAQTCHLPESTHEEELLTLIREFNAAEAIDGILVQLPLPQHISAQSCLLTISPEKDVDGFHPENVGKMTLGLPGLRPCTPQGILSLLHHYHLSPAGKKAVVVGRSSIVGRPLSILLSAPGEDATVTLCHSHTQHLDEVCREADFLFLSVGKARFFGPNYIKEGAVVVDVGINRGEHGIVGDADFHAIKDMVSAITPVPGGVGPMTVAMLLANTVLSWTRRR